MKYRYKLSSGLYGLLCAGMMSFLPTVGRGQDRVAVDLIIANADQSLVLNVHLKPVNFRSDDFAVYVAETSTNAPLIELNNVPEPNTYLGTVTDSPDFENAVVWGTSTTTSNFTGGILVGKGLEYTVVNNVISDDVLGSKYTPFYDVPTMETLQPSEETKQLWSFDILMDVQNKDIRKVNQRGNRFGALNAFERLFIQAVAVFVRDTKLLPKLGPVVLRMEPAACPYEGQEDSAKKTIFNDIWTRDNVRPITNHWDMVWGVAGVGESFDSGFLGSGEAAIHEMCHSLRADPTNTNQYPNIFPAGKAFLVPDAPGNVAEGSGIMGGGTSKEMFYKTKRFNYLVPMLLNRNRIARPDKYTLEGDHFTWASMPPYAAMDVYTLSAALADGEFEMNVMANDFDANGHAIELLNCETVSARGSRVRCENGLVYYTVNPDLIGLDYFHYTIQDSEGMSAKGVVNIDLRNNFTFYEAETNNYSGLLDGVTLSSSGGESVLLLNTNHWVEFSIDVQEEGLHTLKLRYASNPGELLNVDIDDGDQVVQTRLQQLSWNERTHYNLYTGMLTKGAHTVKVSPANPDFEENNPTKKGIRVDGLMLEKGVDIKISFQPIQFNTENYKYNSTHEYLPDNGGVYANRDAGLKYGWSVDLSEQTRYAGKPNQAEGKYFVGATRSYEALHTAQLQNDSFIKAPSNARWNIALPNGEYHVQLFSGLRTGKNDYLIEGEKLMDTNGTNAVLDPTNCLNLFEQKVTVSDHKLTIKASFTSTNASISYLTITNIDPNTAPTTTDKFKKTLLGGSVLQNLRHCTSDAESIDKALSYSKLSNVSKLGNEVTLLEDGFKMKLTATYAGSDEFDYVVTDPQGLSATGTISVAINGAPIVENDTIPSINKGGKSFNDLRSLTTDETPDAELRFSLVGTTSELKNPIVIKPDGYTAELTGTFIGLDKYRYVAKDLQDLSSTGTVWVTIHSIDVPDVTKGIVSDWIHEPTKVPLADASMTFDENVNTKGISLDSSDAINLSPITNRTWSLWFSADAVTNQQMLYEQGGKTRGVNMYLDKDQLVCGIWGMAGTNRNAYARSIPVISAEAWYHVALVLDGDNGTVTTYLDGESQGVPAAGGSLEAHGSQIGLGFVKKATRFEDGTSARANYKGSIKHLRVYDSALGANKVKRIYKASKE